MKKYDLIIKNAKIIDGTGAPWFRGDVGVKDGKINYIGNLNGFEAEKIIDAKEKTLAPGFVDCHTHSDFLLLREPEMVSKLAQGVTTVMIGACGISPAPIVDEKKELLDKYVGFTKAGVEPEYNWNTFGEYLNVLEDLDLGVNIAAFLGHGTIRLNAMGFDDRLATPEEMEEMKEQIKGAMEDGAFGMTTGLVYPPGVYSDEEELVELSKVLKDYNGVYLSHVRNESNELRESIQEVINIARKAGVAVQAHHHKACGKENWGTVKTTLNMIEAARKEGVDITLDQYPYPVASTTLRAMLPPWANEGGIEKIKERLQNTDTRKKIYEDIINTDDWDNYLKNCDGAEGVQILFTPETAEFEGKTLVEVGEILGIDPLEAAFELIIKNNGADNACYYMMSEEDVKFVMKSPVTMIGSDSIPVAPGAKCHPRTNGTFPRVLGKYVREEGAIELEEAIRKMTSFPATRFGLHGKGLIKVGMDADLVLFDPDIIIDGADFIDPFKLPEGIEYVIVNGCVAMKNNEFMGEKKGKVLRRT